MKRLMYLIVAAVALAPVGPLGCGQDQASELLSNAENVATKGEALVAAIKAVPPGDVGAASAAAPKIAESYAQYAKAVRARADANFRAQPFTLTTDQKVRDAKVSERLQAFVAGLLGALGSLTKDQVDALSTPEMLLASRQSERWATDPWYLQSYELLGECEDLQILNQPCEWAERVVELSEVITSQALLDDIKDKLADGYEVGTWQPVLASQTDIILVISTVREKLMDRASKLQYGPRAGKIMWSDWVAAVKKECPEQYERLKVCGLDVLE